MPVSVGFVSLGCPKNTVDSERMLALMGQEGLLISADTDNADVVVINTCGFIESAKQEAIETIRYAVDLKEKGQVKKVIAAGCLAQRMGADLGKEVAGIDAIMGLGDRDNIAKIVKEVTKDNSQYLYMNQPKVNVHDDRGRLLITPGHYAYLRISEGCNRNCTFCTIPSIRGSFVSRPMNTLLDEARELVEYGTRELVLIAQDSIFYGIDQGMKHGLVKLLKELEKIDGLDWIRVMYLYPASIDDEFISCVADSEKIVNYVDMPIQHINDTLLRSMRRSDTQKRTTQVIEKFRAAMPDMTLRTTCIVGFPGETDEHFEQLLEFVKWAQFDALGCFTYQHEPGTPAYDMDQQVPEEVKHERRERLMLLQQEIAFENARKRVGQSLECIIDDIGEPGFATGRFFGQAPEIDSVCLIENFEGQLGDYIEANVIDTDEYDLVVKQND